MSARHRLQARCAVAVRSMLPAACVASWLVASAQAVEPASGGDPVAQPAFLAPLAEHALLLDAARGGATLVVVGERGIALSSHDDGQHWEQGEVPVRSTLTGVFMHDDQLGWAVGHDSVVLRTDDGGKSWTLQNYAPDEETPLLDVWFADANRGFAVGAYGKFLTTSDGGDTWTARDFLAPPVGAIGGQASAVEADAAQETDAERGEIWEDTEGPLDFHLNQIAVTPEGKLYIAAEAGHIFRSEDGGETWSALPSPYDGSFFGVLPLGGDALLVVGLRGHIFRSEDNGGSWMEIASGTTATLTQGVRLADGTVLVGGLAGTLLESHDDARTFTLHERPDRLGTSVLLTADSDHLLLVGEGGREGGVRRMTMADALTGAGR